MTTFTNPPPALKGGDYAKIEEPPKPHDIQRCQYKLQKHHNLTLSKSEILHYTGRTRWADVRVLSEVIILRAWKAERKERQSALERYLDGLRESFRAYYQQRQNVAPTPLLPAGALRQPIPEPEWAVIGPAHKIVPYNDYGHSLWVKYGQWQQLTAGMRCELNGKTYVSVYSEYGCRWHPLAQIIEWQRNYAALHTKAVAA